MYRYKLIAPGMAGWSGSQGCPAKKFNFVSSLVTSFIIGNSGISKVDVTGAYNVIRVIGGTHAICQHNLQESNGGRALCLWV